MLFPPPKGWVRETEMAMREYVIHALVLGIIAALAGLIATGQLF